MPAEAMGLLAEVLHGGIAAVMIFRKGTGASGSFRRMRRKHEDKKKA